VIHTPQYFRWSPDADVGEKGRFIIKNMNLLRLQARRNRLHVVAQKRYDDLVPDIYWNVLFFRDKMMSILVLGLKHLIVK